MTTRPLVPVLAALLLSAAACKPDRSKPRIGADAAVAASPAPSPATPIAPTAGGDAGAAPATRGQPGSDAGEPEAEPDEPAAQPDQEAGGTDGKAAASEDEDRAENLKVLPRTMTVDQVTEYMSKQVGRGLGVKCGFCHEGGDFAADGNPHKKKARAMIRMTADLNQRFFGGKRGITCFTCHKGHDEPAKK